MARLHLLLLFVSLTQAEQTVTIRASSDNTQQPALVWFPTGISTSVPLVVHLHSWSSHFDSSESWKIALAEAQKRNWAFISPEFRGPNDHPEACASPKARQDILDAVFYMRKNYKVDANRVYLLGGSGGGYMTLIMAPDKHWRAASAWVPIADLADWYHQTKAANLKYWKMIEACTGGPPDEAPYEYQLRSPLVHLRSLKGLPIDIQAGIADGHNTASVPVSHSLRAFNALALANRHPEVTFTEPEIAHIVSTKQVPPGSPAPPIENRRTRILLRRTAGPARITLFDGGHETDFPAAFLWFDSLNK